MTIFDTPNESPRHGTGRQRAIDEFLDRYGDSADRDLLAEMIVTVCRLARDRTGRGELKLLSKAFKELRYAFKVFGAYDRIRKVSLFGSSRTDPDHAEYQAAEHFGRLMQRSGWMVITGAGGGIMQAGHDGAGRDASFGLAIRLPYEQETNEVIADDPKLINFNYFFTRKLLFIKEASAVALFPGGFGTQDEGFEALTLVQTSKSDPLPIVLVDAPGGTYWERWRHYVAAELLDTGKISPEDMSLFTLTDDVEVAARHVVEFYRRYHSSRYVRERFVMRLNESLSAEAIEELNGRYQDIITAGKIEQHPGPIDGEEGEWPDKPRIVLQFDRKNVGRLYQLIADINEN